MRFFSRKPKLLKKIQDRIAETRHSRNTSLDLSRLEISEIPAEVGELTWLESLDISHSQIADLTPLAGLKALQVLYVWETQVADLTPLAGLKALRVLQVSGTQVADLTPLAGLSALQSLNVSETKVADLTPLAGLKALQGLDLSRTQVSDLTPLAGLSVLQSLNVSDTAVADLTPLAGLKALQVLRFWGTQVADLTPLAGLNALQRLDFRRTQVANLMPLAGLNALQGLNVSETNVSDVTPLVGLKALQVLHVSRTRVANLAPLAGLSALQELAVSQTQVSDLTPLAGLSALQSLAVSGTPVTDLTPLARLLALQRLHLKGTQVSDLAPLAGLPALLHFDVADTRVADLSPLLPLIGRGIPVRWKRKAWEVTGPDIPVLNVENCPLTNPPPEIVRQGNVAVLNYFRERAAGGVDHLYEAKMLILGEGGAGKTSLLRRLYQPDRPLPTEDQSTKGIAIHEHDFLLPNKRRFRLNVWDFGGQEIYHATHQFFLTHRSLYVLVDDTRKDNKSVSDEGFKYWLELIDVFGGHSPVLIFQNEKGGRSKAIDLAGIKGRYDNVKERYSGNLENKGSADAVREAIDYFAGHLDHIGEELPAHWIKVRADIETRAAQTPHITREEYFDIYRRHLDFDETKALHLSRYLHDLGVFLHFQDDPLLARTVILQNQWATEAVFRILDDEVVKKERGRFTDADCKRLWLGSAYADKHLELLALMQKFELCYALQDAKVPTRLAPQLLPPAKPSALADWIKPDGVVLRYRYDFLPKGMISRLTVRLHRYVSDPEMAWVTGVLFERDRTAVLAEVLPKGGEIELRARGPEAKELLSVVAADLDALNDSFSGLRDKVDKLIPCNCEKCRAAETPEFFAQKDLVRRKEHGRRMVECPRSYAEVDVLALLDGIRAPRAGWDRKNESEPVPRTIRIFLASSAELREDRDAFDLYFRQQNDALRKAGIYLEVVRWENFLDAMSKTRLQDEYNKAICSCDIFVSLFFTKTGRYTEEEFEVAHLQFQGTGRPVIFTFFKDAGITTGSARKDDLNSLWAFQEKLGRLGHFHTTYKSIEDLKLRFHDQLHKLLAEETGGR